MPTTDVLMPQMGESITEGTVTKWLKKAGDRIGKDEPLFEISTDKVDAEIPSPVSGTLSTILVKEGQTVAVQAIVAQIEASASDAAAATAAPPPAAKAAAAPPAKPSAPAPPRASSPAPQPVAAETAGSSDEDDDKVRSSPLVRRLAKENNVNLVEVDGTGPGGRITKEDLLAHVERMKSSPARRASAPAVPTQAPAAPAAPRAAPLASGAREEIVPMTPMRKKIAERMVFSKNTAAHVSTVFAVDLTKVVSLSLKERTRFEQQEGVKLTYTPFFIRAIIDGIKRFPVLNASISGEEIIYKKDIHMGVAVALEWGLIVPVIAHADEKSFLGLARSIADLGERARSKRLSVSEVDGGTFTLTNPGVYGGLFATPIINPPQVGIIGVGGVKKAPVVVDDAIAIRSIVHLTLSYDHRLIDGAVADQFMASVRQYLEGWDEDLYV
ncbi:MAG: 2-oxo acid dehydrogenase subunit E2 [Acidobacteria bacterium]|nr:2-oxo acid dehydrogenase subunit E2 [Acidobacteriota bacterium]